MGYEGVRDLHGNRDEGNVGEDVGRKYVESVEFHAVY